MFSKLVAEKVFANDRTNNVVTPVRVSNIDVTPLRRRHHYTDISLLPNASEQT